MDLFATSADLLAVAVREKDLDRVQSLLAAKASPSNGDPLFAAVEEDSVDIARLLLESKANVNEGEKQGKTALVFCIQTTDNLEMGKLLFEYKATVNIKFSYDDNDDTLMLIAASTEKGNILKLLIDSKAINMRTVNQSSRRLNEKPLFRAIQRESPEVVSILLEAKADVNHAGHGGVTPLQLALYRHYIPIKIVQLLIDSRASLNQASTFDGITPLDISFDTHRRDFIDILVKNKVTLDQLESPSSNRSTYLQMACQSGLEILTLLVETVSLNLPESDHLLHFACKTAPKVIVQYLID